MTKHEFNQSADRAEEQEAQWQAFYKAIGARQQEKVTDKARQTKGIDRLVWFPKIGKVLAVDEKVRDKDYGDLLVEVFSDLERHKPGWSVNQDYQTDVVAYMIKPTRTVFLIDYKSLRRAARMHWKVWAKKGFRDTHNTNWITRNVSVSWSELAKCGVKFKEISHV